MKNKILQIAILGFFFFCIPVIGFAQADAPNNPEINKLNRQLKLHARNPDSLKFYANKMLKYAELHDLNSLKFSAYVALGNSERNSRKVLASNSFYFKALSIAKETFDEQSQYRVLNNIAMNYKRLNRLDSAFYYLKKLDKYHSKKLEVMPASMAKMNLGLVFLKYQELDSATYYLSKSNKGFTALNNTRFIAQTLSLLGELELQKKAYKKAIQFADSSLNMANKNNLKFLFSTNYSILSRIYTGLGDTIKASEYTKLATTNRPKNSSISNNLSNSLNESIRFDKSVVYETVLKETEDSKQLFKSNFVLAVVMIFLLLIIIFMYYKQHQSIENEVVTINEKIDVLKKITNQQDNENNEEKVIQLKSKASIKSSNILYVKSDGHYVEYHLNARKNPEIDRNTMIEVIKLLPPQSFVRIHKSYIVNVNRIKIINSTKIMLDTGEWINLSRVYKQGLKDILNKD